MIENLIGQAIITALINIVILPILYYAFTSKIKEVVRDANKEFESSFRNILNEIEEDIQNHDKEIYLLKDKINGNAVQFSEIKTSIATGFAKLEEKLDNHIEWELRNK